MDPLFLVALVGILAFAVVYRISPQAGAAIMGFAFLAAFAALAVLALQ